MNPEMGTAAATLSPLRGFCVCLLSLFEGSFPRKEVIDNAAIPTAMGDRLPAHLPCGGDVRLELSNST